MSARESFRKKRILLVEDDHSLRHILKRTLSHRYTIVEASTGPAGLALARKSKPDLLLLDVMLPGTDGFDLAAQIKEDPHLANVPLIFLTARDNSSDTIKGIQAGARHYITKPFSFKDVVQRVEKILG